MAKGHAIHIGVNEVDPDHYGSNMALGGCIGDAKAMKKISSGLGYTHVSLYDSDATVGNVAENISYAARGLNAGDALLLTYAGHGSQVYDQSGDESDQLDETWCLYDRMMLDDEIFQLLSRFKTGVRVLMISDSCHSGTVARKADYNSLLTDAPVFRGLHREVAADVVTNRVKTYQSAKYLSLGADIEEPKASIELISGCQDNQLAQDMGTNGYFTLTLLELWQGGNYTGTFPEFYRELKRRMPFYQSPNRQSLGPKHPKFQMGRPFEI